MRHIRVLTLDSGGVRGLSSLLLLRELMERVGTNRGIAKPSEVRPCEIFDLIVGTGTGGISALFLGRMHMTVDEAIEEYARMAAKAFDSSSNKIARLLSSSVGLSRLFGGKPSVLDGRALERSISDAAKRFLGNCDAPLVDPLVESCHTAVLASTSDQSPYVFRSYAGDRPASHFTIHEVARATVSTAGLFGSISLGNPPLQFIDASIFDYSNPIDIAIHEAAEIWPGSKLECIVSLGTGLYETTQVNGKWAEIVNPLKSIAQACDETHYRVCRRPDLQGLPYFRFNVAHALDRVDVREWVNLGPSGQLTKITAGYTRWLEVQLVFHECIQNLTNTIAPSNEIVDQEMDPEFTMSRTLLSLFNPSVESFLQLTPKPFHGRDKYIQEAVSLLLEERGAHLLIFGPGGIGKTSIAKVIQYDQRIGAKFGDHHHFMSCECVSSSTLLKESLCVAFNLETKSQDSLLVFLKAACANDPLLLILDNFETIWDGEHASHELGIFLQLLRDIPALSLVLTMRTSKHPPGLLWMSQLPMVGPLTLEAACATFKDIAGEVNDDRGKLDELLLALDNVPLAITLMAHLGKHEQPTELLERWNKKHTQLLSPSQNKSRLNNLELSIQLSLESNKMRSNPAALLLLSIIALLPAGVLNTPAISPMLENWVVAVGALCDVGLAFYDSAQTLQVLSPVRFYVIQYHPPRIDLLHDLESFYMQLTTKGRLNPGDYDYQAALVILSSEGPNVEAILTRVLTGPVRGEREIHEAMIQAALDWTNFLKWNKPCKTIIQLAIKWAQQLDKPGMLAECLRSLGVIEYMLSNYNSAMVVVMEAQMMFEALGEHQQAMQCLHRLGEIHCALENYESAQEMFIKAHTGFEILGDRQGVAKCLQGLGNVQQWLNNYTSAQAMLSSVLIEFKALGMQLDAAYCLKTLGDIQFKLQSYENALKPLTEAQNKFVTLCYRHGSAQCQQSLAETHFMLNNYEVALEMYSAAGASFEAFGNGEAIAQCLQKQMHIEKMLRVIGDVKSATQAMNLLKGPGNARTLSPIAEASNLLSRLSIQEPFSKQSNLCLDGQITQQSKYVVASGGFADVWTGMLGQQMVAIKIMRSFSSGGTPIEKHRLIKRLWREYLAWFSLSHPNILGCLGFSYDFISHSPNEVPSLISHWMVNGTVLSYIASNPDVDRLELVVGVANGLSYLHGRKPAIVHGDIRAGNILVSDTGVPCLTDFGLSRIMSETRGMSTSSEVAGSLRWMSPELFHGEKLSKSSDIWAYGMTILEIMSGKRPYHDINLDPLVLHQILAGRTPLRPLEAGLMENVWDICQNCWHSQAVRRPSISEVLAELTQEHDQQVFSAKTPCLEGRMDCF